MTGTAAPSLPDPDPVDGGKRPRAAGSWAPFTAAWWGGDPGKELGPSHPLPVVGGHSAVPEAVCPIIHQFALA